MDTLEILEIKTKDPESRWVALDIVDGSTVLAEGKTREEVEKIVEEKGIENYMFSFVPESGASYIL